MERRRSGSRKLSGRIQFSPLNIRVIDINEHAGPGGLKRYMKSPYDSSNIQRIRIDLHKVRRLDAGQAGIKNSQKIVDLSAAGSRERLRIANFQFACKRMIDGIL